MSLRFRLNLLITLMFVLILIAGALLIVHNARRAVAVETNSTARLTLQLMEVALSTVPAEQRREQVRLLLSRLDQVEQPRHSQVEFRGVDGVVVHARPTQHGAVTVAPSWFVGLLAAQLQEFRRTINAGAMPLGELVVRGDPAAEISEAWEETSTALSLLLVFTVLANVLVYIYIGRALRPIGALSKGLEDIELGDYQARLAENQPGEFGRVSAAFNRMAGVLDNSRRQNRELTQKSLAIQEAERRRLAQELHDEMGQAISAIKAVALSIDRHSQHDHVIERLQTIADVSDEVYGNVRRMMQQLRPAILDELGLATAMSQLVDDWNTRHQDCFCRFDAQGQDQGLDGDLSISLYRVVQESLTNVAKHADATEVAVELKITEVPHPFVHLSIRDNGTGIDQNQISPGLGLLGMQERTAAMNGKFRMQSRPGEGLQLDIRIPLTSAEHG